MGTPSQTRPGPRKGLTQLRREAAENGAEPETDQAVPETNRPPRETPLPLDEIQELVEKLAAPFPPEAIGYLPKGVDKEARPSGCDICKGFHPPASVHLPYISHGHVRARLNEAAPGWSWEAHPEPVPYTPDGKAVIFEEDSELGKVPVGMWILLHIPGLPPTPGIGGHEVPSDKKRRASYLMADQHKAVLSDALVNAAMSRGVALYLWQDKVPRVFSSSGSREEQRPGSESASPMMCCECGTVTEGPRVIKAKYADKQGRYGVGEPLYQCPEGCGWVPAKPAPPVTSGDEPPPPGDDDAPPIDGERPEGGY